jgi:hypothetical protein
MEQTSLAVNPAPRELDHYGFFVDSDDASTPPKPKTTVKELEKEWITLLDNWEVNSTRKKSRVFESEVD